MEYRCQALVVNHSATAVQCPLCCPALTVEELWTSIKKTFWVSVKAPPREKKSFKKHQLHFRIVATKSATFEEPLQSVTASQPP